LKKILAASIAFTAAVTALPAAAAPVLWTTSSGGNGHYYDFIASGDVAWANAKLAAQSAAPIVGFQSYLTTITSAAENAFVASISASRGWLGGSDDGSEGNFTWRTGPETGQAVTYTNWAGGEPNNCCGGENYIQFNLQGLGTWNDLQGQPTQSGFIDGYFVEYSKLTGGVPEPATWAMMIGGFGLAGAAMRRRKSVRVTYA
jgi:hypothetical protein